MVVFDCHEVSSYKSGRLGDASQKACTCVCLHLQAQNVGEEHGRDLRRIRFVVSNADVSALRLFSPCSFHRQRSPERVPDDEQEGLSLDSDTLTVTIYGPQPLRGPDSPYPLTPFAGEDTRSPRSVILLLVFDPNLEQLFGCSRTGCLDQLLLSITIVTCIYR